MSIKTFKDNLQKTIESDKYQTILNNTDDSDYIELTASKESTIELTASKQSKESTIEFDCLDNLDFSTDSIPEIDVNALTDKINKAVDSAKQEIKKETKLKISLDERREKKRYLLSKEYQDSLFDRLENKINKKRILASKSQNSQKSPAFVDLDIQPARDLYLDVFGSEESRQLKCPQTGDVIATVSLAAIKKAAQITTIGQLKCWLDGMQFNSPLTVFSMPQQLCDFENLFPVDYFCKQVYDLFLVQKINLSLIKQRNNAGTSESKSLYYLEQHIALLTLEKFHADFKQTEKEDYKKPTTEIGLETELNIIKLRELNEVFRQLRATRQLISLQNDVQAFTDALFYSDGAINYSNLLNALYAVLKSIVKDHCVHKFNDLQAHQQAENLRRLNKGSRSYGAQKHAKVNSVNIENLNLNILFEADHLVKETIKKKQKEQADKKHVSSFLTGLKARLK